MLIIFVPWHSSESAADAIREVDGLVSLLPSDGAGDVDVSLAGLASAGEDRALLQSVLDIEAALFSMSESHGGAVGTELRGNGTAAIVKGELRGRAQDRSTSADTRRSSVESVVGIAAL